MTAAIRAFVENYKKKMNPPITIKEFIKNHNHEIWGECLKCKEIFDLRLHSSMCPKCGDIIKLISKK